jgi:arsenite/tail-anchored protein-transporting ATPase
VTSSASSSISSGSGSWLLRPTLSRNSPPPHHHLGVVVAGAGITTTTTTTTKSSTSLFSLQSMVDAIVSNANSPNKPNQPSKMTQTIFVGGKGGVGKTTTASALAVLLATSPLAELKVLVVSTDPAHSLGDALDVDLKPSKRPTTTTTTTTTTMASSFSPITLTDPLTQGRLDAAEINAAAALEEFRSSISAFDLDRLADSLGIPMELLESLGLRDFTSLLNTPPPGLDELVALSNVFSDQTKSMYDVVIVDTAPTGHTLRLLALPQFLTGFLSKLLSLRQKLSGIAATLQGFLGGGDVAQRRSQTMDTAIAKLELFQQRITNLQQQLKDASQTSFLVVTVPTKLAVAESKRLVTELQAQQIAVNHVVVNQCIVLQEQDGTSIKGGGCFWNAGLWCAVQCSAVQCVYIFHFGMLWLYSRLFFLIFGGSFLLPPLRNYLCGPFFNHHNNHK